MSEVYSWPIDNSKGFTDESFLKKVEPFTSHRQMIIDSDDINLPGLKEKPFIITLTKDCFDRDKFLEMIFENPCDIVNRMIRDNRGNNSCVELAEMINVELDSKGFKGLRCVINKNV